MPSRKMVKFFTKIKHIILGFWYNLQGVNYELMEKRMSICNECEYKIKLTKNVDICAKCGCVLRYKTRIKDEGCLLKKW